MSKPDAGDFATAFNLGRPTGPMVFVQHTVSRTWRLPTETGTYLVKELWDGPDPFWATELDDRMTFERDALAAGIHTPLPIQPVDPAYGLAGRINGRGAYRAYEWADGYHPAPGDDLHVWLGETLATLHQLRPSHRAVEPDWRWGGVVPSDIWLNRVTAGFDQGRAWASKLEQQLGFVVDLSARLTTAWQRAGDDVVTHRDFEPTNVLITDSGPALIDWDSVGYASATLEAGCVAVSFGYDDRSRIHQILDSYVAAGGQLQPLGGDLLVAPIARKLLNLGEQVAIAVGESPPGRRTPPDLDGEILRRIDELVVRTEKLSEFGAAYANTSVAK